MTSLRGVVLAAALLSAGPAAAQSKSFERTLPLGAGGSLRLGASKGSVTLTAWDRAEVEVRARIEADRALFGETAAQRAVEATTVDVEVSGNVIRIRSNYDGVEGMRGWLGMGSVSIPSIHYEIRAPKQLDLHLDIDRSPTRLSGFEGRIDLDADRSEIDGLDLSGAMHAEIDRGGTSTFRNVRGSVVISADRTDLRIDLAELDGASRIEIDRGDADVGLAPKLGVELETRLTRRADFDSALAIESNGWSRRGISGSINGGGPRLAIEADRGRVRLRGR